MLIVDTHAHIYAADEKKYPPIDKPLRPPEGKATVEDLRAACRGNGVEAACLIQTSTFYRFDNRYVCDAARANPDWTAGVCTLDPDDPHSPGLLRQYVRDSNVKGMRSIPARDGRLAHPGVEALWRAAQEAGIVINALVGPEKAGELEQMLGRFSELRVVLDHCMNPKLGPTFDETVETVVRLARFRNLHAKLTFAPTSSATGYPCADMHGACMRIADAYGAERCVWGSDFPNDLWTPNVTFAEHLRIFTHDLPFKEADRARILGETANRLWFGGKLRDAG